MLKYIENYTEKYKETELRRKNVEDEIEKHVKLIEKHRQSIQKLTKKEEKIAYTSWIDEIIEPLGTEIAHITHSEYEVYGPFGMRAQVSIYFHNQEGETISHITITPGDLKNGILYYDTGKVKNEHIKQSEDLNGFNNVTALLPDNIEDIVAIVLKKK